MVVHIQPRFRPIAAALFLILPFLGLRAEEVTIAFESAAPQQGESVHVTTALPSMGAGDPTRAVRLVAPGPDPIWSATFDLPPGLALEPRFYLRDDSPGDLSDPANATLLPSDVTIETAPEAQRPPAVYVYAPGSVQRVVGVIVEPGLGDAPPNPFAMDGALDAEACEVGDDLFLASRDGWLYVATDAPTPNDAFLYVSSEPNPLQAANWAKSGQVGRWNYFLAREGSNSFAAWFGADGAAALSDDAARYVHARSGALLEGAIRGNLVGSGSLYVALGVFQTNDGGALVAQAPGSNDADANLDPDEFRELPRDLDPCTGAPLPGGDGTERLEFELQPRPLPSGEELFTAYIGRTHANHGRSVFFEFDGVPTLPAAGDPIRLQHVDVWWRFGQAFLYDPAALTGAPAAARTETFSWNPENFRARTIRVQLPRDYDRNTAKSYPVLYAQDGQNVFAPGGPFGSWDMDIAVRDLTARGEIPELILVGIDNTSDRFAEYIPEYAGGRGGEFLTAIRDELMPIVDAAYRTRAEAGLTGHIGSSLGGLLTYHAVNDFEATWGVGAAVSPSFQVGAGENFTRAQRAPSTRGRLYIDAGTGESLFDEVELVRDLLILSGHVFGRDFAHAIGYEQGHNEAAWRARTPDILRWMFPPELAAPAPPPPDGLQIVVK